MPDQVPKGEKEERARRAIALAAQMKRCWLERQVGRTLPVLFEEEKDGWWQGHAPNYALVRVKGDRLHNRLLNVEITGADGETLTGAPRDEMKF